MKWASIIAATIIAALALNPAMTTRPKPAPVVQTVAIVPAPLRCATFLDVTRSRDEARIAASLDDFAPMFDRLRAGGGEIGFGLIREDSDKPLIRCYVPLPPEPPVPSQPTTGNVFANANVRKRDDAERKKYEAKHRAWEADTNARINAFIAAITPLLDMPPDAPMTDVTAAIERGDLMLAEPSPFSRATDNAIVLVTDGFHNATGKTALTLRSNAQVVIVNGIGSLGILDKLSPRPLRFESTSAAIRYITTEGGTHAH
jgi:hypothetical protein